MQRACRWRFERVQRTCTTRNCSSRWSTRSRRSATAARAVPAVGPTNFTPTRLRLRAMSKRLRGAGHQAPHRTRGHRVEGPPWTTSLGRRAHVRLARAIPSAERALRTTRRHSLRVSHAWLLGDLLEAAHGVMKFALSACFLTACAIQGGSHKADDVDEGGGGARAGYVPGPHDRFLTG